MRPQRPAAIVWFRLDLRLVDNPAIAAAVRHGGAVVPVFVWAPQEEANWAPGAASRWWLHQSLAKLDAELRQCGSRIIIRKGPTLPALRQLLKETGATAVFWNRRYESALIARDTEIKRVLEAGGTEVASFNSALLFEPWEIQNAAGKPYQVFTAFWRACLSRADDIGHAGARPVKLPTPKALPKSVPLAALELEPKIDWATGFRTIWEPGGDGAAKQLKLFLAGPVDEYGEGRNRPDRAGSSRLSPHLHFGEIGPRQIWQAVHHHCGKRLNQSATIYLSELGWREFAHHLLFHFPHTTDEPLRREFAAFPWAKDARALKAWQRGRTGFPLVDAGLRELWATGWMHNRVRMVVASFLVKDLFISWRQGARWFWDTLVDADLANNTLGWQWTAGCGADAAPYFRVFNPASQGENFDPDGVYVRRWIPELAKLPARWIHKPSEAPADVLSRAGVELGHNYPRPIVRHNVARIRALAAFSELKKR